MITKLSTLWNKTAPTTMSFQRLPSPLRDQIRIFVAAVERELKTEILNEALKRRKAKRLTQDN